MSSIPGWPLEFIHNKQRGATCDVCRNEANPIAIFKGCKKRHNTCGTCFDKHGFDKDNEVYECPRCVAEEKMEAKKRIDKWMEEKSFVRAPNIAPGAFVFSQEAARARAIREGKDPSDIIKKKSRSVSRPETLLDSIDDVDEVAVVRKSSHSQKAASSSSASTMMIESNGTVEEYQRARQVDDCEYCRAALCTECIWEVVNPPASGR